MRIEKIISRFLPLMDISILLVGLFVILLSYANFKKEENIVKQRNMENAVQDYIKIGIEENFYLLPIFAACPGEPPFEDGKLYNIASNFERGDETNIEAIRRDIHEKKNTQTVLCIVTSEGAWDVDWTSRIEDLKVQLREENVQIIRYKNAKFNH